MIRVNAVKGRKGLFSFCVRPEEAETWDHMWRKEYILMAMVVLCLRVSAALEGASSSVSFTPFADVVALVLQIV